MRVLCIGELTNFSPRAVFLSRISNFLYKRIEKFVVMDTHWTGVPGKKPYPHFSSKTHSLFRDGYRTLIQLIQDYEIDTLFFNCSFFDLLKYCSFLEKVGLLKEGDNDLKIVAYLGLSSERYYTEFCPLLSYLDLVILNREKEHSFLKEHISCEKIKNFKYH